MSSGSRPNCRRSDIHQPLERERDDRPRNAAIRRHRAGIGQHAARHAGIGAQVIRAGQFGHRHQGFDRAGRRITGIGADIGDDLGRKRDEFRVGVERAFEPDVLIAAVKRRPSGFRGGLRSRRPSFAVCARARPARHIRARATFSVRSRRQHPAQRRADRFPACRADRRSRCASGAAFASRR